MAQEIVRLCDPCLVEDQARVPANGHTIDLGAGPMVIDLCESHEARLLKPVLDLLELYGVAEGGKHAKPRRKRREAAPAKPAAEVVDVAEGHQHACPWCEYAVNSAGAFRRHLAEVHGVGGFSGWVGNTCPLCGSKHQPRGADSLAGHVAAVHGLPSVSRAVVAARAAGDPYGVYGALQEALAAS